MVEYSADVTIDEQSGTTLYDFQVEVTFGSGHSIFDQANSNGSDVRFRDENDNLIDHYTQNFDSTNENATFWIKVPDIPGNGSTTVTCIYGDGSNVVTSDESATFIDVDRFNRSSLGSDYNVTANHSDYDISVSNNILNISYDHSDHQNGYTVQATYTPLELSPPYTIESRWRHNSENGGSEGQDTRRLFQTHRKDPDTAASNSVNFGWSGTSEAMVYNRYSDTTASANIGSDFENWYTWEMDVTDSSQTARVNGTSITDNSSVSGTAYPISPVAKTAYWSWTEIYVDWWRVREYASTQPSVTVSSGSEVTQAPSAPQNASLTIDANDQGTITWDEPSDWGGEEDDFNIQMLRDGGSWTGPSGGPTTLNADGSASYSASYNPSSDNSYNSQFGIDSEFRFRIQARNSGGNSSWEYTSYENTEPLPPHNPSVSRPDGETFKLEFTTKTDIGHYTRIQFREDTGNGYGSWNSLQNIGGTSYYGVDKSTEQGNTRTKGDRVIAPFTIGDEYQFSTSFGQANARYQFRLRNDNSQGSTKVESGWVYPDYGNEGNVYFEDDFESGDISAWDSSYGGHTVGGGSHGDTGVSGPDQGSYYLQGVGSDSTEATWVQKNLGDLSSESDVIVKCAFAVGSMDSWAEDFNIEWYDGSAWQVLSDWRWEYNEQGWFEVTEMVSDSWLSTDNRIRVGDTTDDGMYGGDHFAVDRVVVSDILHGYTTPAQPSNFSATGNDTTIDSSWTVNATDFPDVYTETSARWTDSRVWEHEQADPPSTTSRTFSDVRQDTEYEVRARAMAKQYRRGAVETEFYSSGPSTMVSIGGNPSVHWDGYAWSGEIDVTGVTTTELADEIGLAQGYDYGSITNGLLAYYQFEGDLTDSAIGYDLTNNGVSFNGSGKIGSDSLQFVATNSEYAQASYDGFGGSPALTFSCWAKSQKDSAWYHNNNERWAAMFDMEEGESTNQSFAVTAADDAANKEIGVHTWGNSLGSGYRWEDLGLDTWHHIVAVNDPVGPQQRIYIDGNLEGTMSQSLDLPDGGTWTLGARYYSSQFYFYGSIDDARLYNRALSSPEIQTLYELTRPSTVSLEDTLQ